MEKKKVIINVRTQISDSLCDLMVGVPGYISRDPGYIPGATRFSEKQWVWDRVHSVS
jgi:hypothetical protein